MKKSSVIVDAAVAFIKAMSVLDSRRPLGVQLFVCELNDKSPFQTILAYVRHCFLPYSKSLLSSEEKKEDSTCSYCAVVLIEVGCTVVCTYADSECTSSCLFTEAIRTVNSKLNDLHLELLKSQESVELPNVTLEIDPRVVALHEKVMSPFRSRASQLPLVRLLFANAIVGLHRSATQILP